MSSATTVAAQRRVNSNTELSIRRALFLQILPGLASLPIYAVLAFWFSAVKLPAMFALTIAIVAVEAPVSWYLIVRLTREEHGKFSFAAAFPWMGKLRWYHYLAIGLPLIFVSMALNIGLAPMTQEPIRAALFSWVPEWFVMRPDPSAFASLPQGVVIGFWLAMLPGMVLIGGATQELYSRGFLLPRTQQFGPVAPLINAAGFAMLHVIAPWDWPVFFVMTLLWALLVWRYRSTRIGLFIHIGMLALQWMGMGLLVFGVAPPN